ncbi:hypothetical protein B0T26DRAFT_753664 [Lasiosphaeria miniovina]|uniref:Uncharacterized protein n=1 Tax=Lasiosphaeria miniovina TaxID=1954250 RepID=A0AA40ACZ6_9PEZI|nr:uncharacterized protein B0T26DRAFT_753664 [Lasiosphaeria miniovina]KAK0713576.1 hypothetical protein B0T26DRAFT_753664 [Lasiosphaeria miniovina]
MLAVFAPGGYLPNAGSFVSGAFVPNPANAFEPTPSFAPSPANAFGPTPSYAANASAGMEFTRAAKLGSQVLNTPTTRSPEEVEI